MLALAIAHLGALILAGFSWLSAVSAGSLEQQVLMLDERLFEQGFNHCQLSVLDDIVHTDLVFLHDQSGVSKGKEDFLKSLRENICQNTDAPKRERIPGTMRVFPLYNQGELYGAIQQGEHRFYIRDDKQGWRASSDARFTHVWLVHDGHWQLSQVLSFEHRSPDSARKVPIPE
jgi:hypothetical protein